jgi:hypothetical protein
MGIKRLCAAVALSVAAFACMLACPTAPHEPGMPGRMMGITDRCVVDYPQFLELMMDGEVVVTDGDLTVHLVKSECGWHYLQRLSILVKAE